MVLRGLSNGKWFQGLITRKMFFRCLPHWKRSLCHWKCLLEVCHKLKMIFRCCHMENVFSGLLHGKWLWTYHTENVCELTTRKVILGDRHTENGIYGLATRTMVFTNLPYWRCFLRSCHTQKMALRSLPDGKSFTSLPHKKLLSALCDTGNGFYGVATQKMTLGSLLNGK